MRRLEILDADPATVFDDCVQGIDNAILTQRFTNARNDVTACFQDYCILAAAHQLFSLEASDWGHETQQVVLDLTKKEFVDLYSKQMVDKESAGRRYYDEIMMLAPLGKCPFCGFGHVSTLDHFLSKARYPAFSVLPANLVPACADCNKGKGASPITQTNQILHPYFEESIVETQIWLFAEVVETHPASVNYLALPPVTWPNDLSLRLANYFAEFKLANRFAVEAATELSMLAELLNEFQTSSKRRDHLSMVARAERKSELHRNSWKAALYEALSSNEWYQEEGYRNPAV